MRRCREARGEMINPLFSTISLWPVYSSSPFFQIQAVDTSSRTMAWLTESGLWSSNSMALSLQLAQEIQTEVKGKVDGGKDREIREEAIAYET